MSDQITIPQPQKRAPVFRGSLVRTVVLQFLIIALIPAIILAVASYLRYQNIIQSSLSNQLSTFATYYGTQIDQMMATNGKAISDLLNTSSIQYYLNSTDDGILTTDNQTSHDFVNEYLAGEVQKDATKSIIELSIVTNSDRNVIVSSNPNRIGTMLFSDASMLDFISKNPSVILYDPGNLFPKQLILATASSITLNPGLPPATIVVFSTSPILTEMLTTPSKIYSTANTFFLTSDNKIIALNETSNELVSSNMGDAAINNLRTYVPKTGNGKEVTYRSFIGTDVFSYIRVLSAKNALYIIEVPQNVVTTPLSEFTRFILILLAGTLVAIALVAFLGARSIANPLVQLSTKARQFAGGDFTQKAEVNRRDEIGLLAYSFNYMVDQLSEFYQSLESKVADRTKQLQIATEIGQQAITATHRNEIIQKVVQSIVERFAIPFAAIFTVDDRNKKITLADFFSTASEGLPVRGFEIPFDNNSLVGWVAANDQSRLSQDIANEAFKTTKGLHYSTAQSELGVPIKIGDRLIAVLNLQSDALNAFDIESVPTFATLGDQIANGLRNIEILESTQSSLSDTAVLYQASSELSRAKTEGEVFEKITPIFERTRYACILLDIVGENAVIRHVADSRSTAADKSLLDVTIPFADALQKLSTEGVQLLSDFQVLTEFSQLTPYLGRRGCSSAAIIPVYESAELLHVLAIGSRDESSITAQQIQPYETFAETVGVTMNRIHLVEKLNKAEKEFAAIDSVAIDNLENTNILDLSVKVHEKVRELFGENIGLCVAINDENHNQVRIPYFFDHEQVSIENYDYSNDLVSNLIKMKANQKYEDAFVEGQYAVDSPTFQRPVRSWLGFPMLIGGSAIGAVAFFDGDNAGVFDVNNQKVAAVIASQLTLAISDSLVRTRFNEIRSLYEEEQFLLDSLLENLSDRIIFKNTENEFIRVSKSMAEYLGAREPQELIGKKDDFQYLLENEEAAYNVDGQVIATLNPVLDKLETWISRSGQTESLISTKVPLQQKSGELYGLLSISQNISEQLRVEQLAKHRADQLQTASEIAKESTAGSMDIQVTLSKLVDLIRSRFGFYHASIFLIDSLGKNAVLRESTGEAGAQMKRAGHKLAVGSSSIVGQATGNGVPVVIGDVTREENYFANPLLPDTRSELAIPLKIGNKVLGALDVQSKEMDAFSQEDINILQVLADQIAVAIQNADLFTHTNQSLTRYRLLHQITAGNVQALSIDDAIRNTVEVLHQAMPAEKITYFSIDENNILLARASSGYPNPEMTSRRISFGQGVVGMVARDRKPMRIDDAQSEHSYRPLGYDTNSILTVPVMFADQLLGVLNIESTTLAMFDDADQEFVTTLADNMASVISNIRLLEQVREQIDRQQKLFEITNKIRRSVDIETIMQTSVSEICSAMNIPKATIHISPVISEENDKEKGS